MDDQLMTEAEVARRFMLTEGQVADLRRSQRWPHLKLGRHIRYTEEQLDAIVRMSTRSAAEEEPAEVLGLARIPGQADKSWERTLSARQRVAAGLPRRPR